jgi:hypothetical protein
VTSRDPPELVPDWDERVGRVAEVGAVLWIAGSLGAYLLLRHSYPPAPHAGRWIATAAILAGCLPWAWASTKLPQHLWRSLTSPSPWAAPALLLTYWSASAATPIIAALLLR